MERYRTLYRIRVSHDYFGDRPCTAFRCRLTAQGAELTRQRGMLLRQTAADEWTLACCDLPAKNDLLTLDLSWADPAYTLCTEWDGFQPMKAYTLELPQKESDIEAAAAICLTDRKREIGSGFCTIALHLTEEMANAATVGEPMQARLCFHAPSLKWEYLFIRQGNEEPDACSLRLEDSGGQVTFTAFKACEAYGRKALRTTSKQRIPLRQDYGFKLRLTAQEGGKQKRTLLSAVPPPQPGQYTDVQPGMIRQICYY